MNLIAAGKMAEDGHNKSAGWMEDLAELEIDDIRPYTRKLTGGNPLMAAALTAAPTAAAGYYFGPQINKAMTSALNRIVPGSAPSDPYRSQDEVQSTRNRMAIAGGLLGAAPWAIPIYDAYKEGDLFESYDKSASVQSDDLVKLAENYVDSAFAQNTLEQDPHLSREDTEFTKNIFQEAEKRSPTGGRLQNLVTTSDLARGAVGAGLGYGAASVAGPVLGSMFGMPRGTVNTLKTTGGLAGALKGSGIVS